MYDLVLSKQARWLQVDMQKKMRLTGIITQGASRMGTEEYIKAFKIATSFDGAAYSTIRMEGQFRDKVATNVCPTTGVYRFKIQDSRSVFVT